MMHVASMFVINEVSVFVINEASVFVINEASVFVRTVMHSLSGIN